MPNFCTVCTNNGRKTKEISFFLYPKDPVRRNEWLKAVGREDLISRIDNDKKRQLFRICEDHFERRYIKYSSKRTVKYLVPDAFPTLKLSSNDGVCSSQCNNISGQVDLEITKTPSESDNFVNKEVVKDEPVDSIEDGEEALACEDDNTMTLIEDQQAMLQFVKVIERFPDIYDHNSETYRRWCVDTAWKKVLEIMKNEFNLGCSVDELKARWKGIRSSYGRYKCKLLQSKNSTFPSKKYYLYDALQFLERFRKPSSVPNESEYDFSSYNTDHLDHSLNEASNESEAKQGIWTELDIKQDISIKTENDNESVEEAKDSDDEPIYNTPSTAKKRKYSNDKTDETNEDLQFFKSILPDIADFTSKEKRKLKVGILKLIDDIESNRNQ